MPKVYVLSDNHDCSEASMYGDIVTITGGRISRFSTSLMHRILSAGLKNSTKDDFIVVSSLTVLCVIACAVFVMKHKRLNLLIRKLEDERNTYLLRTLDFSETQN